jgi:hypothetical protein
MTELRFTLDIDRDLDPPRGTLTDQTGSAIPFTGWMQLASALAQACGRAGEAAGRASG